MPFSTAACGPWGPGLVSHVHDAEGIRVLDHKRVKFCVGEDSCACSSQTMKEGSESTYISCSYSSEPVCTTD